MGKKEEPFGVRISYYHGNNETRWFSTEQERDEIYNLLHYASHRHTIKNIKKKKR